MEDNQLEKFDPSKLMQGVKDRVKATFVSLIPDDQWDGMVKKEIDAFFEAKGEYKRELKEVSDGSGWGNRYTKIITESNVSPFRAIVWDFCIDECIKTLKNKLIIDYFGSQYDKINYDEKVKELIAQAAPLAAVNFFHSMSMNAMNSLREQIRNHQV